MKHIITVFIVLFSAHALACDGCNAFSAFFQHQQKHSLGISFKSRLLEGEIPSGLKHLGHLNHLFSTDLLSEHFNTVTLNGRYFISPKWALLGSLPFHQRIRFQNGVVREYNKGLGDPTVLLEFKPIVSKSDARFKLIWLSRLGVKAPLGSTQSNYDDAYLDHDFQLGTGSYDLVVSNLFFIEKQGLGLTASHLYKKNTANLTDYTFGDTQIIDFLFTYSKRKESGSFIASAGMNAEFQKENQYLPGFFENNGFTVFSAKVRAYVFKNNKEFYAELMLPISQQFNKLETLPLKMNIEVGINLLIDKK